MPAGNAPHRSAPLAYYFTGINTTETFSSPKPRFFVSPPLKSRSQAIPTCFFKHNVSAFCYPLDFKYHGCACENRNEKRAGTVLHNLKQRESKTKIRREKSLGKKRKASKT